MTEGASSNEFWEVICHQDYLTSHSSFEQNTGPNSAPTTMIGQHVPMTVHSLTAKMSIEV